METCNINVIPTSYKEVGVLTVELLLGECEENIFKSGSGPLSYTAWCLS